MIIIDASAMVKLALDEPWSEETRRLIKNTLSEGELVGAPALALPEALNTIWKHNVLIKDLKDDKFFLAIEEILEFWDNLEILPVEPLAQKAISIAKEHKLTVYDSFYVAAGLLNGSPLFTFDSKILENYEKLKIKLVKVK